MSKKKVKLHAIGDIHGMLDEMMLNLEHNKVVDSNGDWKLGSGTLVCTGDLTDRGPKGFEVMEKVYALKQQALEKKGDVIVTMGNHDVGLLNCATFLVRRPKLKEMFAAAIPKNEYHDRIKFFDKSNNDTMRYREMRHAKSGEGVNLCLNYAASPMEPPLGVEDAHQPDESIEMRFFQDQLSDMLFNGMNIEDLVKLTESADLLTWAVAWPAMYTQHGVLFQHCDSNRAYKFLESVGSDFDGTSLEKANYGITKIMLDTSLGMGYRLWNVLTGGRYWEDDQKNIAGHLEYFAPGATKVAHGHTRMMGEFLPMEYANGKAINLDVGIAYSPHHFGKTGRMVDLSEHANAYKPPKKPRARKNLSKS